MTREEMLEEIAKLEHETGFDTIIESGVSIEETIKKLQRLSYLKWRLSQ